MVTHAAPAVTWGLSDFGALTVRALYEILQLRAEVFVVEQTCAFQDVDGSDEQAIHLQGRAGDRLVAYARCFGPGIKYAEASTGRIVTQRDARGGGLGHELVERAIAAIGERWGVQPIRIGAQARLKGFYEAHGFVDMGLPYVEDGIDHLEMLWQPKARQSPVTPPLASPGPADGVREGPGRRGVFSSAGGMHDR